MKKPFITPSARVLALSALFGLATTFAFGQGSSINHVPDYIQAEVGEIFEVVVEIDPAQQNISVADLHMVFDANYLEVLSVTSLMDGLSANIVGPGFDNVSGTITMAAFQLGNTLPSGNFSMFQIQFRALLEVNETYVEHPQNTFPKSIVAYAGENQLGEISPLVISILGSAVSTQTPDVDGLSFQVWPNPTAERSYLNFTSDVQTSFTLEIYDIGGHLLEQVHRGMAPAGVAQRFEVDVKHLADGLYMCRLLTDQGSLVRKLVIGK